MEREPSDAGIMMLTNLINALKCCVSLLRERKHDSILSEVLGIKLWPASPVSLGLQLHGVQTGSMHNRHTQHHSICKRCPHTALPPPTAAEACRAPHLPQMVRSAVLDLVGNLVVANTAFTHTCLHLLVLNFLPPPATPPPEANLGSWKPAEEETMVQSAVLGALTKVRDTCMHARACTL